MSAPLVLLALDGELLLLTLSYSRAVLDKVLPLVPGRLPSDEATPTLGLDRSCNGDCLAGGVCERFLACFSRSIFAVAAMSAAARACSSALRFSAAAARLAFISSRSFRTSTSWSTAAAAVVDARGDPGAAASPAAASPALSCASCLLLDPLLVGTFSARASMLCCT